MNLYEVVNSVEFDWGILFLGPGTVSFEEVNVSEDGKKVIIQNGGLDLSIPKSVNFELTEEDIHFIRFNMVGHEGALSLHKKI